MESERRFVEHESWQHRIAKELLAGWMVQGEMVFESDADEWGIPARRDTGWICLREYPIYGRRDDMAFRDEICGGEEYRSDCREGICRCKDCRHSLDFGPFAAVLDIAWGWKGTMEAAIEIEHKHPVPQEKAELIARTGLVLVEIKATSITHQLTEVRPTRIHAERIVYP
jgi:hypothetical protein